MFAANTHDPGLIKVFKDGKDLYSEMASRVYNLPYNLCKEFRSILQDTNPFKTKVEISNKQVQLLATDKLIVNGIMAEASKIKPGDILDTDQGIVTVSSISMKDDIIYIVNIK